MSRVDVTRLSRHLRLSFGSLGGTPRPAAGDEPHAIRRVRFDIRKRELTVTRAEVLTPRMRRIHLASPELADFRSLGHDDHLKVFVPTEGGGTVMRDYTPRAFSNEHGTLVIDFALHESGPATAWARSARPGDRLAIGGPRGSHVVPDDFAWYLFVGDETALPAIGRWLAALRADVPVTTIVAICDDGEIPPIATHARWRSTWVRRGEPDARDGDRLVAELGPALPPGDGFVWIAGEASLAKTVRGAVLERGHPRAYLRASGYWRRGGAGEHVDLDGER